MIKFFRKIHLWLSLPFGIIVTLVCFSGAMLIFEPEITRSARHDTYYVTEVKEHPLPMGDLMEKVSATLPDSVDITGVTVFSDKSRAWQVNLSKPRRASVFIDQYSGVITGSYERIGFFSTMFKLHRWLLDGANPHGDGVKVGKLLVGISTLVFVIALISGVVIWWPRARRNFRKSLSLTFGNGWKGFWKSLHVAGGMYALVLVLAMALTGLTWSFDWYRSAFYAVCGVEHTPRNFGQQPVARQESPAQNSSHGEGHRGRGGEGTINGECRGEGRGQASGRRQHQSEEHAAQNDFSGWQQIYEELQAKYPEAPQITVGPATASVTIGNTGNVRASDSYLVDASTGKLTPAKMYESANGADKLRGWIYSVHTGALGGIVTRILWLLSALLGASLPLTGYYIWIRHLRKKKNR